MNRKANHLAHLALAGSLLLTTHGCALLTTERVATFVATEVGKKAVKDMKEDYDRKKAAEAQQQQGGANEQPAAQTRQSQDASSNDQLQPMP